jgi:hypothetical protein
MPVLYTLSDPRMDEVRYVGWSSKVPKYRLAEHVTEAMTGRRSHRLNWIRTILAESARPVMRVLAFLETDSEAKRCEVAYIAKLRESGYRLVNGTDGGEGTRGHQVSAEAREKMAAAHRGRKLTFSPIHRARLSDAQRGKKRNPAIAEKTAAKNRGRTHTAEHRAKISAALRGRPCSPQTRAKISAKARVRMASRTPQILKKFSEARRAAWARWRIAHAVPSHKPNGES